MQERIVTNKDLLEASLSVYKLIDQFGIVTRSGETALLVGGG
jgi:hypothetical protein